MQILLFLQIPSQYCILCQDEYNLSYLKTEALQLWSLGTLFVSISSRSGDKKDNTTVSNLAIQKKGLHCHVWQGWLLVLIKDDLIV